MEDMQTLHQKVPPWFWTRDPDLWRSGPNLNRFKSTVCWLVIIQSNLNFPLKLQSSRWCCWTTWRSAEMWSQWNCIHINVPPPHNNLWFLKFVWSLQTSRYLLSILRALVVVLPRLSRCSPDLTKVVRVHIVRDSKECQPQERCCVKRTGDAASWVSVSGFGRLPHDGGSTLSARMLRYY